MIHRAPTRPGRSTLATALAALLTLLLIAPALALGGSARLQERPPSAQVKASGTGKITVVGRFSINGKIPARSSRLSIVDRAGGAQAFLRGKPLRFNSRGRIYRRSASGILLVVGENVTVTVEGAGLVFALAGVGRAQFAGTGRYQLNLGRNRAWSKAWVKIAQPAQPVRAGLRITR